MMALSWSTTDVCPLDASLWDAPGKLWGDGGAKIWDNTGAWLKMSWPWMMDDFSAKTRLPKICSAFGALILVAIITSQWFDAKMTMRCVWIRKTIHPSFPTQKPGWEQTKHDDSQSHKYFKLCVNSNIMYCKSVNIYISMNPSNFFGCFSTNTSFRVPTQPFPPTFGQGGIGTVTIGGIGSYWNDGRTHHIVCRMPWEVCKKAMGGVGCFTWCAKSPKIPVIGKLLGRKRWILLIPSPKKCSHIPWKWAETQKDIDLVTINFQAPC